MTGLLRPIPPFDFELSLRFAPSMNVPSALANGSSALRSQAAARTKATLRVSR